MFYWHCSAHLNSRVLMIGLTLAYCIFIVLGQYYPLQMLFMISLVWLISGYALYHHARLPVVISYRRDSWCCHFDDQIIPCDFISGFVLGPVAVIKLRTHDDGGNRLTVALFYWDIITSESTQAGNWNQLRTILKYSKRDKKSDKAIWLSG